MPQRQPKFHANQYVQFTPESRRLNYMSGSQRPLRYRIISNWWDGRIDEVVYQFAGGTIAAEHEIEEASK